MCDAVPPELVAAISGALAALGEGQSRSFRVERVRRLDRLVPFFLQDEPTWRRAGRIGLAGAVA